MKQNEFLHTLDFMNTELGPWEYCPRHGCKGTLIIVRVRYQDHGPLIKEKVCTTCGKVVKLDRAKKPYFYRGKNKKFNKDEKKEPKKFDNKPFEKFSKDKDQKGKEKNENNN